MFYANNNFMCVKSYVQSYALCYHADWPQNYFNLNQTPNIFQDRNAIRYNLRIF